ncbi:MAG TPA: methyltransferase domain-containing protein [Candidatus Limnocylindrales bacterium]|nr:methyltransferase domain-containing protein [Candidatus Limnocylindrales bacterium]
MMNVGHQQRCSSAEWAEKLGYDILPWGLEGVPLHGDVLEFGPGYGASTAVLVGACGNLTIVESDPELAAALRAKFPGTDIRHGDATATGFEPASYDTVVCFTMLHHVSPPEAQDKLFAEAARVLRPGGRFAGTDSRGSDDLLAFHEDDVYEPIDPYALPDRLRAAGFGDVSVDLRDGVFRFQARLPR